MADALTISVLAFLHILAAVAWLGALIFFISVIGPSVRSLSPPASLEFISKAGARQIRFFVGSATGTIVFGLALLVAVFGTNTSAWPTSIEVGFSLGFIAYLVALFVTVPSFRRADKVAHQVMASPQPGTPPPELAKMIRRGGIGATIVLILLLLTLVYMVGTAFPL